MNNRKPALINPNSRPVLHLTVGLTSLVALVSFALSFSALQEVAAWGHVAPFLAWAVPVVIDASMLVYTLAALVLRARGERAGLAWFLLFVFTVVSVVSNAAHGFGVPAEVRQLVGTLVVSLAPVSVLTTVHTLASLVVAHASESEPTTESVRVAPARRAAKTAPTTTDDRTTDERHKTAEPATEPEATNGAAPTSKPTPARAMTGKPKRGKVTPEVRDRILAMTSQGIAQTAVAEAVSVSRTSVQNVIRTARAEADRRAIEEMHEPLFVV
ncbi:DUF2637 domain-containing protein [Antribacter gilvus]|uniref:DUF2637 domain-containing protein n=1 Tax=Antribacter gilvus TaxID=2304675 RepID=UPI0013DE7D2B|nr:DUF2637 domain-containing protein [Antribacter gilvus]